MTTPTTRHLHAAGPPGRPTRRARIAALVALLLITALGPTASVPASPAQASSGAVAQVTTDAPQIGDPGTYSWSVRPELKDGELERPNFSFDLDKGATVNDAVEIRNFGKTEISLKVYAADALTTEIGAVDLLAGGENSTDVGDWITLERQDVTLAPGKNVTIPFTMKVPDNVESGDHTGGIVTSFLIPSTDQNGNPVNIDRRLGSRMQVRVAGPLTPQLAISSLKTSFEGPKNPVGTGSLNATYRVTNTGNVRMGVRQAIKVKSPIGFPSKTSRGADIAELLPGDSITVTQVVKGAWPTFRTSARVSAAPLAIRSGDVFDPTTVGATTSQGVWSIPWAFLVLLVVVAIGLSVRRRLQAHARFNEDQRVAAAVEEVKLGQPSPNRGDGADGALTGAPTGFDREVAP